MIVLVTEERSAVDSRQWDVALSFASVQRSYVEQVATVLRARGIRCFYDADQQVNLWGRHLTEELPRIYAQDSAVVVVFVSADYAARDWTILERRAALNRALRERREYVLPARFDDTELPGLLSDVAFVDLNGLTPQKFAGLIIQKLAALDIMSLPPSSGQNTNRTNLPSTWNVPCRLAKFTGRRQMLNAIRRNLERTNTVAVTALHGLGGIGKTQLAIEYAWQQAGNYDLVWWIDAEQSALIGPQMAALAQPLGLSAAGLDSDVAETVLRALRLRDRWLLVFDNAQDPADIQQWLPGGNGHVLITSRNPAWGVLGHRLDVKVMNPAEAVGLLRRRIRGFDASTAAALAEELGFLPLALEQAAAYLEQTQVLPHTYLERFRSQRDQMLAAGKDLAYKGSVDGAWLLTLDQLNQDVPAAAMLLELCAFCAPEPIPLDLFHAQIEFLPYPLTQSLRRDDATASLDELIAEVLRYSLARRDGDTIQLHRLTQAVIAAHLAHPNQAGRADTMARLLATAASTTPYDNPAHWQRWSALGPHLLHVAARLGTEDPHRLRAQANRFCLALHLSGQYTSTQQVSGHLHASNAAILGKDHPDTLGIANILGMALWSLGDYKNARVLAQDTFVRRRKVLGQDDPDTLDSANTLSIILSGIGENLAARALIEATLARRRRVLGEDNMYTLASAHNLAIQLWNAGENEAARALDEDTLARRRRVLGDDHTATLYSLHNAAIQLLSAGEYQDARPAAEEVLSRRRRLLGDNHPDTLRIMVLLAEIVAKMGEHSLARELAEDALTRQQRTLPEGHADIQGTEGFLRRLN